MPSLTGETWLTESIMTAVMTEPAAPSLCDELVMATLYLILNETLFKGVIEQIYIESKRRRGT